MRNVPPPERAGEHFRFSLIYWRDNEAGGTYMKDMDQAELQRILGDKKALRQIAGSADAQALAQMLQRGQSQASLKHIAERAAKGDTSQLKDLISTITSSPGGAELLSRLSGSLGQK